MRPLQSPRFPALALGAVLILAGVVWMAQGLNLPFAPGSFMTGDRAWILIGAVSALAGVALVGWSRGTRAPD